MSAKETDDEREGAAAARPQIRRTLSLVLLAGLLALALAIAVGLGVHHFRGGEAQTGPTASVRVEEAPAPVGEPIARLYFEPGSALLPPKAMDQLAVALGGAAARPAMIVLVTAFHEGGGDVAGKAELARQRALAVGRALARSGLAEYRIRTSRPSPSAAGSTLREASRVELRVQ